MDGCAHCPYLGSLHIVDELTPRTSVTCSVQRTFDVFRFAPLTVISCSHSSFSFPPFVFYYYSTHQARYLYVMILSCLLQGLVFVAVRLEVCLHQPVIFCMKRLDFAVESECLRTGCPWPLNTKHMEYIYTPIYAKCHAYTGTPKRRIYLSII